MFLVFVLSNLASVERAAEEFMSKRVRKPIILHEQNLSHDATRAIAFPDPQLMTADGYDLTFGTVSSPWTLCNVKADNFEIHHGTSSWGISTLP